MAVMICSPRCAPAATPTIWRAIWIVALALIVTGCTSNFVYNRLDTLAGWYLRSLVSLNDGQRTQLQDWLTQTLAWHRQSELNRYAQFLRDLSGQLSQPGAATGSGHDLAGYEQTQHRFEVFRDDLAAKISPDAARLLLSLSPAQADELLANMEEKSRKRAAEADAADEWRRAQVKGLTRQVKRWTGSVSAPQKALIAVTVAQVEPTRAEWLESQHNWQGALRQSLNDAAAGDSASGRIQQLLTQPQTQWSAQYTQKERRNRQRYLQLIASLDASLTSQQRDRLRAELLKLARQLETIAQE